ncbi:NADH-quinone oxidoreductase subunit NuoE [bacterium]|nr:NADH-quinone oxidoreductase subunit NuoE [bacterium]HPF33810.1 NADH-quinone oxidoreductase subunit NuoE [Candidatus Krumholzibacteria bacterium]HRX50398.1 NADH-quinone oxidoreductase subunit NuoE [Candidatus Krumholzibacteria bacterium]
MSTPLNDGKTFALEGEDRTRFDALLAQYPTKRSAVMPALWIIQDRHGHVSDAAVTWLAGELELSEAKIREVLSFYFMYRETPQAEHVLQVCHNISCHIMGARTVLTHLEKKLGVRLGETTADGKFALEGVECLGACGMGPCMQVGKHLYEHLTPEKCDAVLESMRKGEPLRPDTDRELEA